MKPGETAHVTCTALTLEGEGEGLVDGRTLRVPGLFPGERAEVRLLAISRQHARGHGELRTLLTPHPDRRLAPCPNHSSNGGRCTGCGLMELREAAQREQKRVLLEQRFGLCVASVEPAPDPLGYRWSSKRVALRVDGKLTLGSYAQNSHEPAPMPGCLVDHPLLVQAFARVEQAARQLAVPPYDERLAKGDLRYVWAKTNGREVVVTLVSAAVTTRLGELVPLLAPHLRGILHSVQGSRGNDLRGDPARLLAGAPTVVLELLDQRVEVGALGFVQPNPAVAAQAYRALIDLDGLQGTRDLAFDLYAGAGVTTRALAAQFAEVVACESQPESAQALGIEPLSVEQFLARELGRPARRVPDLVVANPPRKGLGERVAQQLLALGAKQLRIMSCGPAGLAQDLARLSTAYQLVALRAFDTLPQTPHVELVATLAKR